MNDRTQLPLEDYDHLSAGDLEHRIRSLQPEQVQQLLEYEQEHANRLPIVELLAARMDQLAAGAIPSDGPSQTGAAAADPARSAGASGGSQVRPDTSTEPTTPLRHGVAQQTPKRGRS